MLRIVSLLLSHTERGLYLTQITKTHIQVPVMMARCKENGFGVCDFHLCGSVCGFLFFWGWGEFGGRVWGCLFCSSYVYLRECGSSWRRVLEV